jgi:hypothetical protein
VWWRPPGRSAKGRKAPECGDRLIGDWSSGFGDRSCRHAAPRQRHDARALQGSLGHRSITSTAVYTALVPNRFQGLLAGLILQADRQGSGSFLSFSSRTRAISGAWPFRPLGGVMLGPESCEHVIGMVLDNVIGDGTSIDPAFRSCFDAQPLASYCGVRGRSGRRGETVGASRIANEPLRQSERSIQYSWMPG